MGKRVRAKANKFFLCTFPFFLPPSSGLILLNVVPMHPRVGVRAIAGLKKHAAICFARHHLNSPGHVFLLLGPFFWRFVEKSTNAVGAWLIELLSSPIFGNG